MIDSEKPLVYWNYFLALENDLEQIARYIEFAEKNFKTYSIELAHLLLTASSEVDVVAKALCKKINPNAPTKDINDYKKTIKKQLPDMIKEEVFIKGYGPKLRPWENWEGNNNPVWWQSYNDVKHNRSSCFEEANLKNVLDAMAGLLVIVFYFYKQEYGSIDAIYSDVKQLTKILRPETKLLRLSDKYYFEHVVY